MGEKYKINEKCWICGAKGNSGEHRLKASDIKLSFPDITQKKPAYYHDRNKQNVPVGSRHSTKLHSNAKLCKKCNNKITKPYDRAWEILSNYLYENSDLINDRRYFDLKKVFVDDFQIQANNIQLFFVKLLGCILWTSPDKTQICNSFSKFILNGCSRDDVFLEFYYNKGKVAENTDLSVIEERISKNLIRADFTYILPYIKIKVIYDSTKKNKSGWLPTNSKIIRLIKLKVISKTS